MSVSIYLMRDLWIFFIILIGAAMYMSSIWFIGAFSPQEKTRIIEIVQRIGRRLFRPLMARLTSQRFK